MAVDVPVTGLFFVQFRGPPQSAWRRKLLRAGVTLLRFMPQDTFVAKRERASLARVRTLPFVHWVGVQRADYTVHRQVRAALAGKLLNKIAAVRVLLAPGGGAADRLGTRRGIQRVSREAAHGFGTALKGARRGGNWRRPPALRRRCGSSRPRRYAASMRWRGRASRAARRGTGPVPISVRGKRRRCGSFARIILPAGICPDSTGAA